MRIYPESSRDDYFINSADNILPDNVTVKILGDSSPANFHSSLEAYRPTPLVNLKSLSQKLGIGSLYVKDESHRFGLKAFKGLGASYAINRVLEKRGETRVFCTATDGNHGRAVAWSARVAGCESRIFVPAGTARSRIEAIEREGAMVTVVDGNYDYACAIAATRSSDKGWCLIQDTAWSGYEEIPAMIMAGYTTMFRETDARLNSLSLPQFDIVVLQVGVGSFAASAAWYYTHTCRDKRPVIVLVEPDASDGLLESFKTSGLTVPTGNQQSIMAGLNCGVPSLSAWEILQHCADISIRISDRDAAGAMQQYYYPAGNDSRIISGESGSAGLAGLTRILNDPALAEVKEHLKLSQESNVLLINTEGDTDPESFRQLINI